MKTFFRLFLSLAVTATCLAACSAPADYAGSLVEPLGDYAWDSSQWISAANAPVVTGIVKGKENCRAADGASWFLAPGTPEKPVGRAP